MPIHALINEVISQELKATMIVKDGVIHACNFAAAEMFGYTVDEFLGQMIEVLVPQNIRLDHVKLREDFVNLHKTRNSSEAAQLNLRGITKTNTEIHVHIMLFCAQCQDGSLETIVFMKNIDDETKGLQVIAEKIEVLSSLCQKVKCSIPGL